MTGVVLKTARTKACWTQVRLAEQLGVTQAYLSLIESGRRGVPPRLAHRVARLFDLPPTMLPFERAPASKGRATNDGVEAQIARLGYPGYAYRKRPGTLRHPGDVLMAALSLDELDPRLAEALPWLLLHHDGFEASRLVAEAKTHDLQNRLGFIVALARQVAKRAPAFVGRAPELRLLEEALEPSRLAREETFGHPRVSKRLRRWLLTERSEIARHWNLFTDLKVEQLPYAG